MRYGLAIVSLALVTALATSGTAAAQTAAADDDMVIATAPVELDGTTLFPVRGVSSFPAASRARAISERLQAAAQDRSLRLESLQIVDGPTSTRIVAGDRLLMTITDADAALEQVVRVELAAVHLARIGQAMAEYREARSAHALRRDAVISTIATVLFAAAVVVLVWAWRWMDRVMTARLTTKIRGVEIQSFQVMRAEQIAHAIRRMMVATRTLAFLVLLLVYVGMVLSQWPWTRGLSRSITAAAVAPLLVIGTGIVSSLPRVIFLVVLVFVIRALIRLVQLFFEAIERGTVKLAGFNAEWAQPTYKLVRAAMVVCGLIVSYPYIPGSDSAAFQGISVFIGVVFSLGSSSTISNVIAGYTMIYRRAFKVGDRIRIGDAIGDVMETRLQVTHLRSIKNEELVIPNSQILSSPVVNYSSLARTQGLILHTAVGIGYGTSWREVESMLLTAADRTTGIAREPRPFVLEKKLGKFAVIYELNAYCADPRRMYHVYAELHRHALDVFNEHGVQIMTPAYEGDPLEPKVARASDLDLPVQVQGI